MQQIVKLLHFLDFLIWHKLNVTPVKAFKLVFTFRETELGYYWASFPIVYFIFILTSAATKKPGLQQTIILYEPWL